MKRAVQAVAVLCAAAGLWLGSALAQQEQKGAREGDSDKFSDQHFVKHASGDGLAEVNLGRLAEQRAANPQVKQFAARMVRDHNQANQQLLQMANQQGFRPASTMDEQHTKLMEKLGKMQGSDFDSAYMKHQVEDHEQAVKLFEKASKEAKDQSLRNFAAQTLPVLREHLQMAKSIAGNQGKTAAGTEGR